MQSILRSLFILLLISQLDFILCQTGGDVTDTDQPQGLVIPKGYSNLKIPGRRRNKQGPVGTAELPISPALQQGQPGPVNVSFVASRGPLPPSGNGGGVPFSAPIPPPPLPPPLLKFDSSNEQSSSPPTWSFVPNVGDGSDGSNRNETESISVDVAIQIQTIREVDEAEQKIVLELDLTVHWKDEDAIETVSGTANDISANDFDNLTAILGTDGAGEQIQLSKFEELWKPDIFIERVVKVTKPGLLTVPTAVRIFKSSSSIVYTTRASVKVDCNMDFQYYPADTQHCYLDIRSYQNDDTLMNLKWNPSPGAYLVDPDTDDNFDLQLAHVAQRKKQVKNINLIDSIFDVLQIKISMRRRMSYHIIQTYIPSAFLVFITWLSFLIPEDLIEARIGISMTTLLTLTAMFSAVRENTPIVSYVKAIDIWMVYCIFIVFSTLLEFTFFVWLRNYKVSQRQAKLERLMSASNQRVNERNTKSDDSQPRISLEDVTSKATVAFDRTATLFNRFAFTFFVLNFIIFNIIYWPWLLVSSNHYNWTVNSTLNGEEDGNRGFIDEL